MKLEFGEEKTAPLGWHGPKVLYKGIWNLTLGNEECGEFREERGL